MNFGLLERRTNPRTQAFVPVTLRCHDQDEDTPAHLLDLSNGGAGILATAYNAPAVGQYLDLRFETPNNDGASDSAPRYETGIVVNSATPERGIARLGIRFLQHRGIGSGLFDPDNTLSDYRKSLPTGEQGRRWDIECLFQGGRAPQMAGAN